ncbi:MAG: FHA domain-containing protein [Chloroflexi bacterium]|jgi:hypothetical protein|nr:FHA domain-containing protein [Chloroflexota bacterium]
MFKEYRPAITKKGIGAIVCILILLLLLVPNSVFAQPPEPTVLITEIDSRNFPDITIGFSGKNLTGSIHPTTDSVTIFEDGQLIQPDMVERSYKGVHFSLVINPESSLRLHWPNGLQYYDDMIKAIKSIGPDLENPDVNLYSLHINPDIAQIEIPGYDAWVNAIDAYSIDGNNLVSSLDSLEEAISALETSTSSLDTVLVYITPYLHPTLLPDFFSLVDRAAAINVSMHTWIVMSPSMLGSSYETNMQEALLATGGTLAAFTGVEAVPDPNVYLEGKGENFVVTYQSEIRESGSFDLAVELALATDRVLRSAPAQLELTVEPTRLSFVNPPESLDLLQDENDSVTPPALPVEVLIEFPDGYPRSIISSTLFVNGDRVQTNQSPPYGSFVIDLNDYTQEEKLRLEVRVNDDLGLQGRTPIHTIGLNVFKPENALSDGWLTNPLLWMGLLLLSGLVALIFIIRPRKKPPKSDQAVPAKAEENSEEALPSLSYTAVRSYGSLMKLDPDQTPSAEKPYPLIKEITLIGRDPSLANLVLDDAMLEPLHAEIHFFPDGRIRITDFNSTSGTYVNFKPVSAHGTSLQHADLVHFGSLLFRFNSSTRTQSAQQNEES